MVQPKIGMMRNIAHASTACRNLNAGSARYGSSIAHILENGPDDVRKVVVNGFIRSIRNQKQRSFANVGDGSTNKPLQAILTPEQAERSEIGPAHCSTAIADQLLQTG